MSVKDSKKLGRIKDVCGMSITFYSKKNERTDVSHRRLSGVCAMDRNAF